MRVLDIVTGSLRVGINRTFDMLRQDLIPLVVRGHNSIEMQNSDLVVDDLDAVRPIPGVSIRKAASRIAADERAKDDPEFDRD
jgi:hypothetical protein